MNIGSYEVEIIKGKNYAVSEWKKINAQGVDIDSGEELVVGFCLDEGKIEIHDENGIDKSFDVDPDVMVEFAMKVIAQAESSDFFIENMKEAS